MAEDYAPKAEWVEVTEHYSIPRWHYREAEDGATGGVVINLAPSGEVEVLEGLARHDVTAFWNILLRGRAKGPGMCLTPST